IAHHWIPGLTGALFNAFHFVGVAPGAQPLYYPPNGAANVTLNKCCLFLSQNTMGSIVGYLSISSALADDDPRALDVFSGAESIYWDAGVPIVTGYNSGFGMSGQVYTNDSDIPNG